MIVFLDLVIGSTILVNYSLLKTIKLIFHERRNALRMALALGLSVASLGFFFISNPMFLSMRYLLGIAIAMVAFDTRDKKAAIIKMVIFYLMNFAFIGTLAVFNIQNSWLMIIAMFYVVLLIIIESYKKLVINPKACAYNVNIKGINNNFKGFLDTGNQSQYDGVPIVFMDQRHLNHTFEYFTKISLSAINCLTEVDLYQGGDLIVNNKHHVVYYVFIELNDYDVLLNLFLF